MSENVKPVYIVANILVKDLDEYMNRYAIDVIAQLQAIGAEVLAADVPEILEGDTPYNKTVVMKFPSREVAMGWYESDEYAPFKNYVSMS